MNDETEDIDPEMKARLVEIANRIQEDMKGMLADEMGPFIKKLIDENDVVYGVFQDEAYPGGVGTHLIKGKRRLQVVVASGQSEGLRVVGVPCIELEQAVAAEQNWGDGVVKDH